MRLSRHAKNNLRHVRGTREEVESVVENPFGKSLDHHGNPVYVRIVAGRIVRVIVADDDPNYVITVYPEGHYESRL